MAQGFSLPFHLGGIIMSKRIISLLLLVCLTLGVTACKKTDNPDKSQVGKVYYLNFKPEADQAWQALAKEYTEKTGIEVKVVTAASGDYETTLNAQMGKEGQPTIFNIGNAMSLADWSDYALDLTDTMLAGELTTNDYNLFDANGKLKAIGYCYESFGIIVNKKLLTQAGYKLEDIKDFLSLKAIAEDIHGRADALGFDAFTSSGLDDSSSWRFSGHLMNMPLFYEFRDRKIVEQPDSLSGTYLDNFRKIWDLYIQNTATKPADQVSATGDDAKADFLFVHHGISWGGGFRRITGIDAKRIGLLFSAGITLYAAHLPLDAHVQWGNNAQLAQILGLKELEPFCNVDGMTIGWAGTLSRSTAIEKLVTKLKEALGDPECNFYGDPDVKIKKIAIVSGGCSEEVLFQASEAGADLLLTGEFKHQLYHPARELGMNVIAAGHYATETTGVKAVMALIQEKFGIEVEFADCPTGL
jgi:dinuclear metal center YbgI/SA1388 family protein